MLNYRKRVVEKVSEDSAFHYSFFEFDVVVTSSVGITVRNNTVDEGKLLKET